MRPIPENQINLLCSDNGANGNFSLYFPRMVEWNDNCSKDKDSIVNLGKASVTRYNAANNALQSNHEKQSYVVNSVANEGFLAFEIRAVLTSPFISGLGSGHPTETGMILDRNTGLPFLPASGIKGVLRTAHTLNLYNSNKDSASFQERWIKRGDLDSKGRLHESNTGKELMLDDKEPSLRKYFGDTDTNPGSVRGQIVFLDAFPAKVPLLKTDIMNPHFSKYYNGNGSVEPVETETPIPIKFLAVTEGTEFIFRCYASPLQKPDKNDEVPREWGEEDEKAIIDMFMKATQEIGFGAKTAIGYGRFFITKITVNGETKYEKPMPEIVPAQPIKPIQEQHHSHHSSNHSFQKKKDPFEKKEKNNTMSDKERKNLMKSFKKF